MTTAAPPSVPPHTAFTCRYDGRSLRLISDIEVFPAFVPPAQQPPGRKYTALYDTGATHSSVSPKVVAELNLPSIGATNIGVGGGSIVTTSHLVNIALPNRVMFSTMRVAKLGLHGGIDVLVGMDILGVGDFAVTHHQGKTTFSFCVPSRREIDFVGELEDSGKITQARSAKVVGRNDQCPCGSGKKYKKCCGA